ncbi:aminodeoxychorismate/anthranilate synthase component II [Gammaproteobacteria bacterium]|jgi:anthranilate synthase component 2|nr:aminodeoxychorismate/anthranilate synthase component II [Gammaproteobacteria bacterium]
MILVIDNYDSFTYNLVHYIGECDYEVVVKRNDEVTMAEINSLNPEKIVISPGPCTPNEAGISTEIAQESKVPLLGVCLGHQSIGVAFGAKIIKAPQVFHGKKSKVMHSNSILFKEIPSPYSVVRYHSLIIDSSSLPKDLKVISTIVDDPAIIMGVEHISRPIYGVQFHPESIDTDHGMRLIKNFLNI